MVTPAPLLPAVQPQTSHLPSLSFWAQCSYLEMGYPAGRAALRITACVLVSSRSQQEADSSLKLGDWRRVNKGTVREDLGGMQGNLNEECSALGDCGSRYHPRPVWGRLPGRSCDLQSRNTAATPLPHSSLYAPGD